MTGKSKPERYTSERCWIAELVNDAAWPEFSLARCRVEPGVTTELHALAVHEIYVLERGAGLVQVGEAEPLAVGPGDAVTIPKHAAQRIRNTGNEDLVFLCLCTPRFSQECYTSLE